MSPNSIPIHELSRGDQLTLPFRHLRLEATGETYNASEPHRHNYYEVFFFQRGGGSHVIDFRTWPIVDRSVHLVAPGQVHRVQRVPDSYGHILLFTEEFHALGAARAEELAPLATLEFEGPTVALGDSEAAMLQSAMEQIEREFNDAQPHRDTMLRAQLEVVLIHVLRRVERQREAGGDGVRAMELTARLRQLIDRHYITVHAPAAYAGMLSVTTNHLNTTVRRRTGRTIGELVQERLFLEARRLLFHTALSVKEIAFSLGFDDPSYFTRVFRKHVGVTPQAFRDATRRE